MAGGEKQSGGGLDEAGRSADVAGGFHLRCPAVRDKIIQADPTGRPRLVRGGDPCVNECHIEPSVLGVQVAYAGYFADLIVTAGGIVKIVKTP